MNTATMVELVFHTCPSGRYHFLSFEINVVFSGDALIGAVVGDYLFIHGGISNASEKSQVCRNSFYKIQVFPLVGQWTEITSADSPFLSQHKCIPHHSSGCLCFVGE